MLTYTDRLAALRKTKIEQTLQKRTQNGYTDLDDFGTVPLPEGYYVEPWYNSENGSFYGYDGMCENFCRVIGAHPAYVDPMEMLCGRWRDMLVNYRGDIHFMPEWMKKNQKLRDFIAGGATAQWSKRWDEKHFPYDELKPLQQKYNITTGIDSDAHFACDYRMGLSMGFGGFLKKIEKYRKLNPDKEAFYHAEERCVRAIVDFIDRHIERIDELLETEARPEIAESLRQMKQTCQNVRLAPPKTFREACQWVAFFNCAARIYTRDGAGFQLDTLLYPYYKADTEAGILDDETAIFLIANLYLIDPHYYSISGINAKGEDMTNRLSYLALEAGDRINTSINLTVRVHPNCDPALLHRAVELLFKNKNAWPRFCSDVNCPKGYMRTGADRETAYDRIAVGCNWMAVPGREFPMSDVVKINIAKVMEVALEEMKELQGKSTELLFSLFEKHLAIAVDVVAKGVNLHLDHAQEVTPELIMNLMMHNTLERGEDISRCAELYTVALDGAGLAVVADSFGAMQTRVEQEDRLTWEELYAAMAEDFSNERTRLMLSSTPRYGAGNTSADAWAKRLTELWVKTVRSQKMPKGRQLVPGWFSWARSIEYGKTVGATPNGRRAGAALSHGANPNPGFRRDGAVTALSNAIASVQCGFGNTAPLQLEFDPQMSMENGGLEFVENLIRTHFELGGTLININVLDGEKLMKAHEDPDLYPDLVVRVTGFTAYFVSLSPQFRQLVIDRFLYGK